MLEINLMLPCAKNMINTVNAQYLPSVKAYELQTWYTDGIRSWVLAHGWGILCQPNPAATQLVDK